MSIQPLITIVILFIFAFAIFLCYTYHVNKNKNNIDEYEHLTLVKDCYNEDVGCYIACQKPDNTIDPYCDKVCRINSPIC